MEDLKMSLNTKLEVALEIISAKIGKLSNKGYTVEAVEMKNLIKERDEMYSENEEVINKIINIYGPEMRKDLGKE